MKQCGSHFFLQNVDEQIMLKTRAVELFIYQYETQQKINVLVYDHLKFDCNYCCCQLIFFVE